MRLTELLKSLEKVEYSIYGDSSKIEVRHIVVDSRVVGYGDIFIAKKGAKFDGNDFSRQAVENGAVVVVSEVYNPFLKVVQIISKDVVLIEALLAARCYGFPEEKMHIIGVTGTNGKTTVVSLIKHLSDAMGKPCGSLGTLGYVLGAQKVVGDLTTPDASSIYRYLGEMVKNGLENVAMEVSSIGLVLDRLLNVPFHTAIFTNLTLDHLDFHETWENYVKAKGLLFASLAPHSLAIFNNDSPYSKEYASLTKARVVSYGIESSCDLKASNIVLDSNGASFVVTYKGRSVPVKVPLVGVHNVYNVLAALCVAVEDFGFSLEEAAYILARSEAPRGRLERVDGGVCPVFIDYAHTPDALENVLLALKSFLPEGGRVITVFGCGGDRDKSKRAVMAQVAEKYGFSVVTTDNPRAEDPESIIREICSGFSKEDFCVEIDRKQAIKYALSVASDKDIILVAGKGHETYQIFKHRTIVFDDKEEVLAAIASSC
ncbi:UDP-N-acetylmuramoyl-L-alanyl-D-glutamate--2,6-diaminopimelate ligase [Chlamydiifrater phoenicopteri]|uniref:UDP-N-acetylmuramoyl-L-alanyl-D-glutamate--2, 6-diaminopimelate ligase n=1 Tax=Chlamydiifrater phoenicopteri TaxID=2681469 RepID=UPI001BCE2533